MRRSSYKSPRTSLSCPNCLRYLSHHSPSRSTDASLQPMKNSSEANTSAKPLKAHGTSYITNKRLVFVSATTSSQPGPATLGTLSCPLNHLQDGRFVQPFVVSSYARLLRLSSCKYSWLSANYWECLVRPVHDGGLTVRSTLSEMTWLILTRGRHLKHCAWTLKKGVASNSRQQ